MICTWRCLQVTAKSIDRSAFQMSHSSVTLIAQFAQPESGAVTHMPLCHPHHEYLQVLQSQWQHHKKLGCSREAARRSMSLKIVLSHSRHSKWHLWVRHLSLHRNYVSILYRFWDIQLRIAACPWNLHGSLKVIEKLNNSIDHIRLSIGLQL